MIKDDDVCVNSIMAHVCNSKAPGKMTTCQNPLLFEHSACPAFQNTQSPDSLIELTAEVAVAANTPRQRLFHPSRTCRRHVKVSETLVLKAHYIYCPCSSSRPEDTQRPIFKSLLNSTYRPSLLTGLKTDCFSL